MILQNKPDLHLLQFQMFLKISSERSPYIPRKNYASEQVATVGNLVMWLFILSENQWRS